MKKIIIPIAMAGLMFSCSGPATTQAADETQIKQEVMELDSISETLEESTKTLKKKADELESIVNEL